jgi:hypothetical protein
MADRPRRGLDESRPISGWARTKENDAGEAKSGSFRDWWSQVVVVVASPVPSRCLREVRAGPAGDHMNAAPRIKAEAAVLH